MLEKVLIGLGSSLLVLLVLMCLYVLLIVTPVLAYAKAKCLEQGYPRASITWNLQRYCINLDGVITVKVDKQ